MEAKKADKDNDKEDDKDIDNEEDIDLLSNNDVEEIQKVIIETLGNTNLTVIQETISYLKDFPLEVIKEALVRTARKQKKWDYAKGILNNLLNEGIDTLEKIKAKDIDFKDKSVKKEETEQERIARETREMEERLKNADS